MFRFICPSDGAVELYGDGKLLLRHTSSAPALFLGCGKETIRMFRGNFDINDRVEERIALRFDGLKEEHGCRILFFTGFKKQGFIVIW